MSARPIRALSYAAVVLGFAQVVFGAIVRISGSGLGCGDHWPDCYGSFTPARHSFGLLIEISHRYGAAVLTVAVVALAIVAFARRDELRVRGAGGIVGLSAAALSLVVVAALFGAVTVKLGLRSWVVVTHLAIAMTLLAVLAHILVLAQRPAPEGDAPVSRSLPAARAALGLAFLTLLLGALTANTAGAPASCLGFPWCRAGMTGGAPLGIQIAHRTLAVLLFLHLFGMAMAARKREPGFALTKAAWWAFGLATLQIVIAAALVEMHLPLVLRSLHEAAGTLLWISIAIVHAIAAGRRQPRAGLVTEARRRASQPAPGA